MLTMESQEFKNLVRRDGHITLTGVMPGDKNYTVIINNGQIRLTIFNLDTESVRLTKSIANVEVMQPMAGADWLPSNIAKNEGLNLAAAAIAIFALGKRPSIYGLRCYTKLCQDEIHVYLNSAQTRGTKHLVHEYVLSEAPSGAIQVQTVQRDLHNLTSTFAPISPFPTQTEFTVNIIQALVETIAMSEI